MDSATLNAHFDAHFVKFTKPESPRKNGLAQLPLRPTSTTSHPSTIGFSRTQRTLLMDSATLMRTFRKICQPDTARNKWTRPTCPTCHPSTNGPSHTQRTFRKIYQADTPRQKWTRPTSPTPNFPFLPPLKIMESATLSAHFVKFTNLTPSTKMDSPNFPYAQLPLPATPQLMESDTLSAHFNWNQPHSAHIS